MKLNVLFGAETTAQDQLVYVNHAILGKMLESPTLRQQAANNTKKQFATSPDLKMQLTHAIMPAYDAHTSTQALNLQTIRRGILDILLVPFVSPFGFAIRLAQDLEPVETAQGLSLSNGFCQIRCRRFF